MSSIFRNEFPSDDYEVIVVDNGSSDRTVQYSGRYPTRVFNCTRKGIGPPRNLGVKMARGDIVCLTDSDCIVEENWLKKIQTFFDQNPDADGVGGPVFSYPFYQNKIQKLTGELFEADQMYPKKTVRIQCGSLNGIIFGTNSAFKKEAVLSANGYSEPGGSNLELAWRLASNGKNLFFDPNNVVYHIFPYTLNKIVRQQYRWGAQLTNLKRSNGVYKGISELSNIPFFLGKRFLSLIDLKNIDRELLHFIQLLSFSMGQIRGESSGT